MGFNTINSIFKHFFFCLITLLSFIACTQSNEPDMISDPNGEEQLNQSENQAAVTDVTYSGEENNYTFSVTIESPDTGCDQYADWWEVISPEGQLLYRRILGHSHVDEQPFTRSGRIVPIKNDEIIYVRAHLNNLGYGSLVYSGTIVGGLFADSLDASFAEELMTTEPLPTNCAY